MDFRVEPIKAYDVYELLKSKSIQDLKPEEKEKLNLLYSIAQNNMNTLKMTRSEYRALLSKRPLLRFRPLKNSFLKRGDKKLLAIGLEIDEKDINNYIDGIIFYNFDTAEFNEHLDFDKSPLDKDKMNMFQDYVYRYGTREQALNWLKHELSDAAAVLKRLYRTLKKDSGGIYDYFERPCHLLDNNTAHRMHTTIKYSLDNAQAQGYITEDINKTACEWSLRQIYNIQSNQKLREALKIVKYSGEI